MALVGIIKIQVARVNSAGILQDPKSYNRTDLVSSRFSAVSMSVYKPALQTLLNGSLEYNL